MPAVVSGLVVSGLIEAEAFAAGSAGALITKGVIDLGLAYGLGKIVQFLNKEDEDTDDPDQVFSAQDAADIRQAIPYIRIILGEAVTGGVYCFHQASRVGSAVIPESGDKGGAYLVSQFLLASHACHSVDWVKLGEYETFPDSAGFTTNPQFIRPAPALNNSNFPYVAQSVRLGSNDQAIDPIIARNFPDMPADFRQVGHTTVTMEYYYGHNSEVHSEVYGTNVEIKPRFKVKGLKVYDPRDSFQDPNRPETWVWTRNAALNMVGLLVNRDFTRNLTYDNFDMGALREAATICDQTFKDRNGLAIPKYTIDGVITTNENQLDIIESMILAMFGKLTWQYDKYFITAGVEYDGHHEPAMTITEDDLLEGFEYNVGLPSREIINSIKGRFITTETEAQIAESPIIQNDGDILADGQVNQKTLNLRFTTGSARAQRLMRLILNQARLQRKLVIRVPKKILQCLAGDIIRFESKTFDFLQGEYMIDSIKGNDDFVSFSVELSEYDPDVFNYDAKTQEKELILQNLAPS